MSAPDRRVPQGKPLAWTDEQIDALAEVSEDDIDAAAEAWRRDAGRLAGLIDAAPLDDDEPA